MADEKLSQLPSGTAIADADLSYWDQSAASVSQPASAISTYTNSKLPLGSATQRGIVEVDGTTITALAGTISAVQPTGANPSATAGPTAVNGTAATFLRSDGAPAVQKASASQFGIVEVDNTTITASAGVISAVQPIGANPTGIAGPTAVNGSATTYMRSDAAPAVQKASSVQFGIVEVDGTSITASGGVISSTGGAPPLAGGNLTYFVATTGSDSNPGTVGSPFATIAHALSVVAGFDYENQFFPTVNVANGTYNLSGQLVLPNLINLPPTALLGNDQSLSALIQGNISTPSSCVLDFGDTFHSGVYGDSGAWIFDGFQIQKVFDTFWSFGRCSLSLDDIIFVMNNSNYNAINVSQGGSVVLGFSNFTMEVTGSLGTRMFFVNNQGELNDFGVSLTIGAPMAFAQVVTCFDNGQLIWGGGGVTNPGNLSGQQFNIAGNALLDYQDGGDRSTMPGSSVGTLNKPSNATSQTDPKYQVVTPSTGNTVTITPGCHNLVVNPAGSLLALTIKLPGYMSDGEVVSIGTSQTISTLTTSASTTFGSTPSVVGAPPTLAPGGNVSFVFDSGTNTWFIT